MAWMIEAPLPQAEFPEGRKKGTSERTYRSIINIRKNSLTMKFFQKWKWFLYAEMTFSCWKVFKQNLAGYSSNILKESSVSREEQ